jgi:hypothetical protein
LLGARGPAYQVDRRCFSEELVWVEVVGSNLAPFFSDGDLIRAAATEEPDEAYLGRLCILFLREQGHVLGVPSTGASEGHYNVRCLTGPDFENVEIELFLPVLATFYRSASTGKVFGSETDIAMPDWRVAAGLSLARAARVAGVAGKNPARTWHRWETGEREPPVSVIAAVEELSNGRCQGRVLGNRSRSIQSKGGMRERSG